ncbi:MAG TPA: helix-turn-helix domain-containing protein [Bacteroidia bacterium]|nr:helix-turn-helix domain-containing protein [Bacteroidia bacterium]
MRNIKHTREFDLAYRFVTETNLNIFLTGKAGTGKTTFLKYLRENSFKKMVVAAPTGVAAINAGGVTLHSLFQLPFAPFIPSASPSNPLSKREGERDESFSSREENESAPSLYMQNKREPMRWETPSPSERVGVRQLLSQIRFNKDKINLLRNLELLVIDEASMVASHTVDAINTILRSVRKRHRMPFGGVQVLFIGDMHQLQPVVKRDEWQFLKDYYPSVFFFDSTVLRENIPVMIELKEIFRQKDDAFIEVLNEIRNNNLTRENLDVLNSRLKRNFVSADDDGYVMLTTHNSQADRINEMKLKKLNTHSEKYQAEIRGNFPEHLFPADSELELKEGAQVMFVKNDTEEKKYFNGKTGVIADLTDDYIKVKCKGEDFEITVKKYEWENISYKLNNDTREIIGETLGSFTQYPLRLAWAITIHKSQGLTFEKAIIDAENAFANGQVYVALSRCTTLEGLILTTPINRQFLGAHQELTDWQEKNNDAENLPQKFNESRDKFVRHELENIFTWTNWFYELRGLQEILNELKDDLPMESLPWLSGLMEKQKSLYEVAEKFKTRIAELCNQNPVVEKNEPLQQRIKDAARYFSGEITKWMEEFRKHPLSTDTKKTARKLDALLNDTNGTVQEIIHKFNHCRTGFFLSEYLKYGKKLNQEIPAVESTYAQNKIRSISSNELQHAGLYERIAELRRQIGSETNLPLYRIFNNQAIKNVCVHLPKDKDSLLKVNGFGKSKVGMYGDEVLELVNDYCVENNIQQRTFIASAKRSGDGEKKKTSSGTIEESVRLFKLGKTIEQIASERNLAGGTIESHLSRAIRNKLVQIDELMPMEEARRIAAYFPPQTELVSLTAIKEKAPGEISYGKLQMVLEWLMLERQ